MGAAVFLVALLLRTVFLLEIADSAFHSVLVGDAALFDAWARAIAAGDWLGEEVFYQAPLYPYFMGLVYRLLDADPQWVRGVQILLGSASCSLVAIATARRLPPLAGWVAGMALAIYAPAIWLDGTIHKASLGLFLTSLLLVLLLPAQGRVSRARAFACGAVLGLLVLTRENAGILLPVLLAWLWLGPSAGSRGARFRTCAGALAGLALVLGIIAGRNLAVGGEPLPTSYNAGVNFYIGNGERSDGLYTPLVPGRAHPDFERVDATRLAEAAEGRELSSLEVSRYWFAEGIASIRAAPGRWAGLLARKGLLTWNRREVMDAESLEACRRESVTVDLLARFAHFGLLGPLALAGAWFARRRWRSGWLLPVAAGALALSITLFFVTARFRLGLVPFLAPLAGAGVLGFKDCLSRSGARELSVGLLLLLAGGIVSFWPTGGWPFHLRGSPTAVAYANVSAALRREGRPEEAVEWGRRALEEDDENANAHFNLGLSLAELDAPAGAEIHLERSRWLEPSFGADVENQLGVIDAERGELDAAIAHFRASIALDPDDPRTHGNLGLALSQRWRLDEAIEAFERALGLDPDHLDSLRNLAFIHELQGSLAETAALHRRALVVDPEFRPSLLWLAWTAATHPDLALWDPDEAVQLAERAATLAGGEDPRVLDILAAAYAAVGRFEDAMRIAHDALELAAARQDPDLAEQIAARLELYRQDRAFRSGR